MSEPQDSHESVEQPKRFSIVRGRKGGALGRFLYDSHYGRFVEWDTGPAFADPQDIEPVNGVVGRYVNDLVSIIRWLHPDEQVDQRSMAMARREIGDRAAVLLNDIALSGHDVGPLVKCPKCELMFPADELEYHIGCCGGGA